MEDKKDGVQKNSGSTPPAPKPAAPAGMTCEQWAANLGRNDRKYRGTGKAIAMLMKKGPKDTVSQEDFMKAVKKFRSGPAC